MSYRLLIKIAALASTCWMSIGHALAESRVALVIGNSNYSNVTALPNPANDAKAMAKFLGSAGFQVLQAPDLKQTEMRRTIGNFASMVAEKGPDTVALVFYAGHGLQVDGENYLVPVDASIQREADVPLQAMRLADLMNALASVPSKARIVILDACRNNPFSEINKTTGRGLAIVDAPSGSLVSYSTAPGTEALDGDGANSPFTSALTKVGQKPNLPIEQALKQVRLAVNEATNRQQTPWESSSLTTEFAFFSTASTAPVTSAQASAGMKATPVAARSEPSGAKSDPRSVESWRNELKSHTAREAYEIVIREDKVEAYQAYLELYPSQSMAPVVRTIFDRRREMIAWYTAVTINTTVSYQTFLAAYASSDFAVSANRLIDRIRTRSVGNAASAFASAGPTCPCSQPTLAPTPRQKRADVAPATVTGASTSGSAASTTTTVTKTVVSKPVVTVVEDDPPPVRIRVRDDWPRRHGRDHGDGPKHPEHKPDPPSRSVDKGASDKGTKPNWGKHETTTRIVDRGVTFNRGTSLNRGSLNGGTSFNRGVSFNRGSFGGGGMGHPMFRAGSMGGRHFF